MLKFGGKKCCYFNNLKLIKIITLKEICLDSSCLLQILLIYLAVEAQLNSLLTAQPLCQF